MNTIHQPARFYQRISFLILFALLLAACSQGEIPSTGGEPGQAAELALSADEAGLNVPDQVPSGLTTVNLSNSSQAEISISIGQLNTDVTLEQFMQAFEQDDGGMAAVSLVSLYGGMDVAPGAQESYQVELEEGTYVAIGFGESEGPPLVTSFQVAGAPASEPAAPSGEVMVDMQDFDFVMPDEVPAGEQVWDVTNTGAQWHEFLIVEPGPGLTQEQLLEMLSTMEEPEGPPPFENVAFFGPMSAGKQAWVDIDLEPGTYWALCFLPDFASGVSHVEMGMIHEFVVTGE